MPNFFPLSVSASPVCSYQALFILQKYTQVLSPSPACQNKLLVVTAYFDQAMLNCLPRFDQPESNLVDGSKIIIATLVHADNKETAAATITMVESVATVTSWSNPRVS